MTHNFTQTLVQNLFIEIMNFRPEVVEKLGCYVYSLVDPRNGKTFYVGRGVGNRIFEHNREALKKYNEISGEVFENQDLQEAENLKIQQINDIRKDGFEVIHLINRYVPFGKEVGRTEEEARAIVMEVEAALIDVYDGLTNIQGGYNSDDRGLQHVSELVKKFIQEPIKEFKSKVMIISINKSYKSSSSVYEAVRRSWTASKKSAEESQYVLAEKLGSCVGVFKPLKWNTLENGKIEFEGVEAEPEILGLYLNKRTPEKKKGAMLPFRYFDTSFNYEEHMEKVRSREDENVKLNLL